MAGGALRFLPRGRDPVADLADPVAAFAERWGLDGSVVEYLSSLDEGVRSTVLEQFAPREGTVDVAGKLYAFARSVANASAASTEAAGSPDLAAFAQRWNVDAAGVAWLAGLPAQVAAILVREFDPKEDTQNVLGKMRSFARSIQLRLPNGHAEPRAADDLARRLAEFAAQWGLDETALALVQSMPPSVQATVVDEFDPKGDVVNVNGKLCAFARSIAARHAGQDVLEAFAAHWGLDEQAKQLLRGMPEDVRTTVFQQFDPDRGTRDVSNKLRIFAKGVLAKSGGGGAGARRFVEANTVIAPREHVAPPVAAAWTDEAAAAISDPAIGEFVQRWGLDASTVPLLESLADDVRERVMQEFDPRGNTRNPSGKLVAFVRTVMNGQGRATIRPAPAEPAEVEFLARWGLEGSQAAAEVLARLQPAVRARVMAEFAPGQDTANVLGKLAGFAASVARAAASGWEVPRAAHGGGGGHGVLPPLRAPARGGRTAIDEFADRWGLDEGSRALLRGLEPEVQATVMGEFQPREDVRDPSGKFCAFARSVAARFRPEHGQKRLIAPVVAGPPGVRRRYT